MAMAVLAAIALSPGVFPAAAASLCLLASDDGRELARRELGPGNTFSLSFIHSVSKTPVTDSYKVDGGMIVQTAEIFQAHGAGLPSNTADAGVTGWRHDDGRFIIDMRRPMGPIRLRVQAAYRNTLHIDGANLPLASLGQQVLILASCHKDITP